MNVLPASFYEQIWKWGKYNKSQMQYLVDKKALTIEDYERITGAKYPPTADELNDTVFTTR